MSTPNEERNFKGPVRWLLGRQLIGSLKKVALYTALKGKPDLRDWMRAEPIRFDNRPRQNTASSEDEFWFDYLADVGDGMTAMYSIACLCLSDLWTEDSAGSGSAAYFKFNRSDEAPLLLPRGEFLFVGGDTSYHVADYATLANRFQLPFKWAFEDLQSINAVSETRRPLFGIPGNHDYYDLIDGFGRQFLKPIEPEDDGGEVGGPQLSTKGFERHQSASYAALQLPFDWWFWGVDDEVGHIDSRQLAFFAGLGDIPRKLIVATPEPTTVLGKQAAPDNSTVKAFGDLGLEPAFLQNGTLDPDYCRLDLSGDTHHYARYWGSPSPDKEAPAAANYASVVSGSGGAFLHPSHVDVNEVEEQALYPAAEVSRAEVAKQIMNPLVIVWGGFVFLAGALIAAIVFFAGTAAPSSRGPIDRVLNDVLKLPKYEGHEFSRYLPPLPAVQTAAVAEGAVVPALFLIVSLILAGATILYLNKLRKSFPVISPEPLKMRKAPVAQKRQEGSKKEDEDNSKIHKMITLAGALAVASGVALVASMFYFFHKRESLSPFGSSLLILCSLIWSGVALAASVVYAEFLRKRAPKTLIHGIDYWPAWVLATLAALLPYVAYFLFGRFPAIYVTTDVIFSSVALLASIGLIVLAVVVGGALHGWPGKAGFGLLGVWHALLQIATPFLLVRAGNWQAWLLAIAAVLAFAPLGYLVAKRAAAWLLTIVWLIYGSLVLALPIWFPNTPGEPVNWWIRLLVVMILGALFSCVWLGWYLAVSLAFNGHENEAGGAARIERYKEFIRIRLTKSSLTAYVIGIDDPRTEGRSLKPKIVDVFELKAQT